jgi:hypothetical protein
VGWSGADKLAACRYEKQGLEKLGWQEKCESVAPANAVQNFPQSIVNSMLTSRFAKCKIFLRQMSGRQGDEGDRAPPVGGASQSTTDEHR